MGAASNHLRRAGRPSVAANDAPAFPSLQNNPPTLYGRPVVLEPGLAAPAANKVSGVFADFTRGAYVIRRVRGLGLVRQSEIHSDAGNVGYRIIERVDGKVLAPGVGIGVKHSAT